MGLLSRFNSATSCSRASIFGLLLLFPFVVWPRRRRSRSVAGGVIDETGERASRASPARCSSSSSLRSLALRASGADAFEPGAARMLFFRRRSRRPVTPPHRHRFRRFRAPARPIPCPRGPALEASSVASLPSSFTSSNATRQRPGRLENSCCKRSMAFGFTSRRSKRTRSKLGGAVGDLIEHRASEPSDACPHLQRRCGLSPEVAWRFQNRLELLKRFRENKRLDHARAVLQRENGPAGAAAGAHRARLDDDSRHNNVLVIPAASIDESSRAFSSFSRPAYLSSGWPEM